MDWGKQGGGARREETQSSLAPSPPRLVMGPFPAQGSMTPPLVVSGPFVPPPLLPVDS